MNPIKNRFQVSFDFGFRIADCGFKGKRNTEDGAETFRIADCGFKNMVHVACCAFWEVRSSRLGAGRNWHRASHG